MKKTSLLASAWILSTLCAASADSVWLVRDNQVHCAIVYGAQDQYAAQRLERWFSETVGVHVPLCRDNLPLPDANNLILLGSADSNPLLARIAQELRLDIAPAALTDQGYVTRTARFEDRDWLLLAGGGPDGTRYAVADLINGRLATEATGVRLEPVDVREIPRFKYRWLWNWDHRMDWGGPGQAGTLMGGGGTFSKAPEAFLIDFKRCVDYMADHKFNGLILWGFLRDTHGGVETSQELCRYASERGVRILPGVGTSGYAGYYFEGNHPYNADTWLAQHPELRAIDQTGLPTNAPCPSKKANQDWLDAGAKWLFDTFEIGGVNLEMGDFFVCYCDDCKKARAAIDASEPDYYKDMAISHSVTLRKMRALDPNAWLSYATYTSYTADMTTNPPKFLAIIPDDAICQWTLTHMVHNWPVEIRPMARHNLGYLHWCNRSTHTEDDFYLEQIRDICRNAAAVGFEGLDTYGELSPEAPNVELFYLAWEAFLWNPDMPLEDFVNQRLAPLYGGPEPTQALLQIIPLVQTAKDREAPQNILHALALAQTDHPGITHDAQARWDRLIAYLARQKQANHDRVE